MQHLVVLNDHGDVGLRRRHLMAKAKPFGGKRAAPFRKGGAPRKAIVPKKGAKTNKGK